MAQTGLDLLQNPNLSQAQALVKNGYKASTARLPKQNGLSASQCLEAAAVLYPDAVPTKLVSEARRAMASKLASWRDPAKLDKARGGELARVLDVVERWYGASKPDDPGSRLLENRLQVFASAVIEAQRRGLLPGMPSVEVEPDKP